MNERDNAPSTDEIAAALSAFTETLLGVARASFDHRAPRTFNGDPLDVLAFLINSTADEVQHLVAELEQEREELRRLQARTAHAEKLAALGRLAAGVAHELNQPLTAVLSIAGLLSRRPNDSISQHAEHLGLLTQAGEQMTRIVEGILTFARPVQLRLEVIPAHKPLMDALELMLPRLRERGVEVKQRLVEPMPTVFVDSGRLQQVFANLLGNACDALQEHSFPRTLVVGITATGNDVEYSIEDNGPGVPSSLSGRLFEPFFTTKEFGSGTGLGLSISLSLVEQHRGRLRHESVAGSGARFVVSIPAARTANGSPQGGPGNPAADSTFAASRY